MHKLTENDEKNKNMKTIKKEEEEKYDEETEERRARPSLTARTGPVTLSTEEQQKRVAARATAAMAQVLRRRPRSMMMWGRKKVVIKTYPDGGQEILVPQTLTAEQQQYEFPPRSRFLKKLATSNETEEKRRFSNPPQPFGNTPDQLALNEWFSKTLSNATKSESNNNNNNRNWVKRTSYKRKKSSEFIQLKSDAGKKWAHTLSTLEPPTEDCSTHYVPKKLLKCSPTTGNSVTIGTATTKTIRSRSSLRHSGTTTTTIVSDINTIWKEYHKRSELSKSTTPSSSISSTKTYQSISRGRKVYDDKIMTHHSSTSNNSISSERIRRGTISMNNSISNSNLSQYRTISSQNMSRNMSSSSSSNNNNNNNNNSNSSSSRKGNKNTKINSNISSVDRSRSITKNEISDNDNDNGNDHNNKKSTPITGMVQLIGLLHHSLKEQQQRSIDRMEKLEYLLLDERKQREQAEYRKDQTMKKVELMYQQLHDHIENTKENLLIGEYPAPPSYQSLLMEKVSSSLSGLEQSIERHQQQLKKRQSLKDHPLKKMSTPLSMSNQRRMVALRQ